MIRSILFDLDGVLVDAAPWHAEAFIWALGIAGKVDMTAAEHLAEFNGLPTQVKLNKLLDHGRLTPGCSDSVRWLKQEKTRSIVLSRCRPEEARITLLNKLGKYKLGCVTNCTQSNAELLLDKAGLLAYFPVLVTNEECQPKPSPEPYQLACSKLGVKPEETIAIEDNAYGVESAIAAGCQVARLENYAELSWEWLRPKLREDLC